jgi:hypothetical protein
MYDNTKVVLNTTNSNKYNKYFKKYFYDHIWRQVERIAKEKKDVVRGISLSFWGGKKCDFVLGDRQI